jgi:PHP family Zn ribbon phosphoesterase
LQLNFSFLISHSAFSVKGLYMKYYYDFHIHSCLSPCGSDDMTPNNIVNMAKIKGLDVIAVTDHNTCKNCEAVIKVGKKEGILVIPALELQTSEDIHILCYFPSLEKAKEFEEKELSKMSLVKNNEAIFGKQIIMDENDNEIGSMESLLINSSGISIDKIYETVKKYNGAALPAHIDKPSFSVLEVLGEISEDFKCVEIANSKNAQSYKAKFRILTNSDAHYLWDIAEKESLINLNELTVDNIIRYFNGI